MKLLAKNRGLTLIETMATAVIVAFVTLAVSNFLSSVYKGITSMQLKTISYENVTDNIDKFKKLGFSALRNNPDNLMTYAAIKAGGPSYYYEEATQGNTVYEIYRIIQYAEENEAGDLVAIPPAEGVITDLKVITVHVKYLDRASNVVKSTERVTYVSNREVPSEGSSIEGTLAASAAPALTVAKNPVVFVTGHPELTTAGYASGGAVMYKIKNLQPGKYSLWAEATGYYPATYTANPIDVTNTVQLITGKNITLAPADTGILTGVAYYAVAVTLKATGLFGNTMTANTLWSNNVTPADGHQLYLSDVLGAADTKNMYTADHTSGNTLCTDFAPTTSTERPIMVEFNVSYTASAVAVGDKLRVYFSKTTTGTPVWSHLWNIQPNPWPVTRPTDTNTALADEYYTDITLSNNSNTVTLDITTLYDEGFAWTQTAVNDLCVKITAIGTGFNPVIVDNVYLKVHYATAIADGVGISANDGLSSETMTDSAGRYTLYNVRTGPGAATNTITAYAIKANFASPPHVCTRVNLIEAKGQTKTVNFALYPAAAGTGTVSGKVIDTATNLGIASANIIFTLDSNGATFTTTSDASGNFTISPAATGTGKLTASKANYIQTSNSYFSVASYTPNVKIYMKPTGRISGRVTNNTTSAGIDNIQISAKNASGGVDAKAITSGGGYYTVTVTAGGTYSTECILESTEYRCVFPAGKKCININIGTGTSVTNQNLRLDYNMLTISGTVAINTTGSDRTVSNGALIIAQPVGNTIPAHGVAGGYFSSINDGKEQNTYFRTLFPSYTAYVNQNGTYTVSVPVYGGNYDVYAYYTDTVITGVIVNPRVHPAELQKLRVNYFKKLSAIAPGSASANFNSTWTPY